MKRLLLDIWNEENGQDLSEYSLIVGFLAVLGLTIYITLGNHVKVIWTTANSTLATAALTSE